ncbi:MAG: NAD(P)-dependent dehydrogenase (short-subunit alcohol dehydrogenase family) [Bacteroidia bacterium]|jgi:NAD(P)-dependent dehydrogenase (short-subunit alcohol dehydrogenase family)
MNLLDMTGKVVLITGGSRGLGRAMALAFAEQGADIIVASRKLENCQAVAAEVEALGRQALAYACHVGHWHELEGLVDAAYARFGRVDVLINNAGMSPVVPTSLETSEALFDKVVGLNFKAPFRLMALVGSRMVAAGGGSIINISSSGALRPRPQFAPYAASKAALNTLTEAFAQEFAPTVRVNTISPGTFRTDIAKAWPADLEAKVPAAMGRYGEPAEIVSTALYLASDASSYTTGTMIRVDGGLL